MLGPMLGAGVQGIHRTSPCSPAAPDLMGKPQGSREHKGQCVDSSTWAPYSVMTPSFSCREKSLPVPSLPGYSGAWAPGVGR